MTLKLRLSEPLTGPSGSGTGPNLNAAHAIQNPFQVQLQVEKEKTLKKLKAFFYFRPARDTLGLGVCDGYWGPTPQPATIKFWTVFCCFPCYESLYGPLSAVKRRLIIGFAKPGHQETKKMAALQKRHNKISEVCVPFLQCSSSGFIILLPIL